MRFSKEMEAKYAAYVRRILVLKPDAIVGEIQSQLERKIDRRLSENYVAKLRKKVIGEQIKRYIGKTKALVISQHEDFVGEMKGELLGMLAQKDLPPLLRLAVISKLIEMHDRLTKTLLYSGVLEDEKYLKRFDAVRFRNNDDEDARAKVQLPRDSWEPAFNALLRDAEAPVLRPSSEAPASQETKNEESADRNGLKAAEPSNEKDAERKEREQREKELGILRRARRMKWPEESVPLPLEERIRNYRENFGKGEPAKPWDVEWEKHKGLAGPGPL